MRKDARLGTILVCALGGWLVQTPARLGAG